MAAAVPKPMFSQRGSTCGPDVFFTILFESDKLRHYFAPLLSRSPRRLIASKDEIKHALGLAIQRYQKMVAVPRAGPALTRRNSTNSGEGAKILKLLSSCGPDNVGMRAGDLKPVVHAVLEDDAYDLFPSKFHIRVASLPDRGIKSAALRDIFGLIFELDYYKPEPLPRNNNNNDYDRYENRRWAGGALYKDRKHRTAGHIVGFFKRDGKWYFADNEVGWLHKMRDQSFVPDHVIKAVRDAADRGGDFEALTLSALPYDIDPDAVQLSQMLGADGVFYTGSDVAGEFDPTYGHFAGGEVHVLMARGAGGGRRKTRRKRRT